MDINIQVRKTHIILLTVLIVAATATASVNIRDPMNIYGNIDMQGNSVTNASEYRFTQSVVREYAATDGNPQTVSNEDVTEAIDDFLFGGSLTEQELNEVMSYFKDQKSVDIGTKAAGLTENGKVVATGAYAGTEDTKALNFTFSSDIDMQGNDIYNAGNIGNGDTGNGGGQANSAPALAWSEAEPQRDRYSFQENSDTAEINCDSGEVLMDVTCFSDARSGGSDAEGDHIEKCDSRTRNSASVSAPNDEFADPVGVSGTCVPTK